MPPWALLSPSICTPPHTLPGESSLLHLPLFSTVQALSFLQGLHSGSSFQQLSLITFEYRGRGAVSEQRSTRRIREESWLLEAERLLFKPLGFQLGGPPSAQAQMPGWAPGCFLGQKGGLLPSNTFPEALKPGTVNGSGQLLV